MTIITASDLKQNSMKLQYALRDDLLVTKRDKPFVVVMDYEKYVKLKAYIEKMEKEDKENQKENSYPSITFNEACERVANAVESYKSGNMETISLESLKSRLKRD